MILIENIRLFDPEDRGECHILIGGKKIESVSHQKINVSGIEDLTVINGKGKILIPGLIDAHIHISGAGGEGGPKSRTPQIQLSHLLKAGITTVVGCLGTDGYTRRPAEVLMKAKALKEEGITAYMYTGAYQIPPPTVTDSVAHDLTYIEEVIGVGEIALSDIRSSHPNKTQLIQLAQETRVAAMLAGKSGILNIHMGDAKDPFQPLYEAVKDTELKITQFMPTHCNRNSYIFEDAKQYGKNGYVDLTTSSYPYFSDLETKPSKGIKELLNAGVPENHITMTSDAVGSLPGFNDRGELERLDIGQADTLYKELFDAVDTEKLPMPVALKTVTSNPADILRLPHKGRIAAGKDADFVIIDNSRQIHYLCARGKLMIHDGVVKQKGIYE